MEIRAEVKFNPGQARALAKIQRGARHFLIYGGARSGKTFLIIYVIVLRALLFPGSRHLIYRLRLGDAIASIWMETLPRVISLFPALDRIITPNETRHILLFPNGSEIWVGGVDDKRSHDSILGKEYATIYGNEASQIPYMTAWKVRTRLAQKVPGCKNREFLDLNPTGKGHHTYKEFIRKIDPIFSIPGHEIALKDPEKFDYIQINPGENKENIDAEYLAALENAPASQKRRFYDGEYADDNELVVFPIPVAGFYDPLAFDEWVKKIGPGKVRFVGGLDIGFDDADGFVIIAYEAGNRKSKHWLVYEHKARRQGLKDLSESIKAGIAWKDAVAKRLLLPNATLMIYGDSGAGGKKMIYDLRSVYGLPVRPAYKRDKLSAIELLQDEVKAAQFMTPVDGGWAQECEAIVWTKDANTGEVIRTIDDTIYHPDLMDAILYAMRPVWMAN